LSGGEFSQDDVKEMSEADQAYLFEKKLAADKLTADPNDEDFEDDEFEDDVN